MVARTEASGQGSDCRFIVTHLNGAPRWLYEDVYCAHGQAKSRTEAHKLHLASVCTSCTTATANQTRLLVHTAAYWLLHTLRGRAPKTLFWRDAQLDTIRLALMKVAARVTELVTRITVALPSSYPDARSWTLLSRRALGLPPRCPGQRAPHRARPPATPRFDHPRPRRHPQPRPPLSGVGVDARE